MPADAEGNTGWPVLARVAEGISKLWNGDGNTTAEADDAQTEQDPAAAAAATSTDQAETPTASADGQAKPESTEPKANESELATKIRENPRGFIESLDEDTRKLFGNEFFKGMQRTLDERDRTHRLEIQSVRQDTEQRFDELMTAGMTEQERDDYFNRKKAGKYDELQKRPVEQQAQSRMAEQLWQQLEAAGLPRDPNDTYVRMVDFGWDTEDPDEGRKRFQESLKKAADARRAAGATTAPKQQEQPAKVELDEAIAKGVKAALLELGVLAPDGGRASGGGDSKKPTTMAEARTASQRLLEERQRTGSS